MEDKLIEYVDEELKELRKLVEELKERLDAFEKKKKEKQVENG